MAIKCQECGAHIADDPQWELEDGEINEYVAHAVHPEDSIAVSETWYYCDPECAVEAFGGGGE